MVLYKCRICPRDDLDPEKEDVHLTPKEDGTEGHDAYCMHCWGEWTRWAAVYGIDVIKEDK